MSDSYDVLVIGAGTNAMVAAAYLAKAGKSVRILERRSLVGGRAVSEPLGPGFTASSCAYSLGRLRPYIAKDLRINVPFISHDPSVFVPLPDGRQLTLWRDAAWTAEEIAHFSEKDAATFPHYVDFMERVADFAEPILDLTPPPLDSPDVSEMLDFAHLGVRFRLMGKNDMIRTMRAAPMCVADFLGEWFETEALKAALAAPALHAMFGGPWSAGTAATLFYQTLEGAPGMYVGGAGALAEALAEVCRKAGAEITTNAEVERILVENGRASGVQLKNGELLLAGTILSGVDPKRTFLSLVEPFELGPTFQRQVRNIKMRGVTARLNLALSELPQFDCLGGVPDAVERLQGRIHIGPTLDYLEKAFDHAKYGRYAREPMMDIVIPSLTDPSMAPKGKHVMSIQVQWAPYHLQEGNWDDLRETFADDVLRSLSAYIPNLKNIILHRQVLTPLDLERTYGLTEGHLHHGEHSLHQLFFSRPTPSSSQYASPVPNLYLCGAGAHPGGGITGAAGANAARELLAVESTTSGLNRKAVKVGAGLMLLGTGLAVGAAVRALTKKKEPTDNGT